MAADMNRLNGRTPPRMPFWWFIVQCVTLALALGIFIASCYAIHHAPGGGPQAFLLFDALMIFIFVGGFLAIERFQPAWYFRIIFIVAYTLIIIFLLSAWAWAASVAGAYFETVCYFGTCYGAGDAGRGVGAALAVGAAFGAVCWVLMIVSLVFYIMAALKDGGDGVAATTAPDAEMGAVKTEHPAAAAPGPHYPEQQPYAQQQTYPEQQYAQQPAQVQQSHVGTGPQQPTQPQQPYQETPYPQEQQPYAADQAQYPAQPQEQRPYNP